MVNCVRPFWIASPSNGVVPDAWFGLVGRFLSTLGAEEFLWTIVVCVEFFLEISIILKHDFCMASVADLTPLLYRFSG